MASSSRPATYHLHHGIVYGSPTYCRGGTLELPHNDDSLASRPDNVIASNPYTRQNFKDKYTLLRRIECWITVPAAKDATRSAALDVGFGSRHLDKVNLMPKPGTAALAIALKPRLDSASIDPISSGGDVLIHDCGGGTVDMTTYTIPETTPRLQFQGLCVDVGAKCGSTYVDQNFNKWMVNKLVPGAFRGHQRQMWLYLHRHLQSYQRLDQ